MIWELIIILKWNRLWNPKMASFVRILSSQVLELLIKTMLCNNILKTKMREVTIHAHFWLRVQFAIPVRH